MMSSWFTPLASMPFIPIFISPVVTARLILSLIEGEPVERVALGVFINPAPFIETPFGFARIKFA